MSSMPCDNQSKHHLELRDRATFGLNHVSWLFRDRLLKIVQHTSYAQYELDRVVLILTNIRQRYRHLVEYVEHGQKPADFDSI